ncbi:MAG: tRNA-dihydrouridine synthase family protein [Candidatus Gracilibacteria bacterium]|nr:tRNA-dihydrouridine synthase family protein [Candidatus Gracilibacteria bacterium]
MKDFWKKQIEKHGKLVFLAPMDGYGDSAYRQAMKKVAPHIFSISEFYSADGLVHSKFLADSVLPHDKSEDPLVIQIFGKDPENFAKAAKIISDPKYNIAGIDVNMGCPAKKVVRSGHGSSLMINVETAFEIVRALNEATHLPISVKTRRSFDGNQDLLAFAKGLEEAGASLITIHGRTMKQAYTGVADWTDIHELQKHLKIPVIGNGDVQNYKDGMEKVKDLAGFMIGRATFGNPWCFVSQADIDEIDSLPLHSGTSTPFNKGGSNLKKENFIDGVYHPSLREILELMQFHAEKLVETKGEKKGSLEIRKHLVQYLKHFPGVKAYRKRLVTTDSLENSISIINEIRDTFKDFLDKRPSLGEIEKEEVDLN